MIDLKYLCLPNPRPKTNALKNLVECLIVIAVVVGVFSALLHGLDKEAAEAMKITRIGE